MYSNPATPAQLRDSYYSDAALLSERIDFIRSKISERPPHKELSDLELRLSLLREERRQLINTADRLARLAAPPAPSPSLAARGSRLR